MRYFHLRSTNDVFIISNLIYDSYYSLIACVGIEISGLESSTRFEISTAGFIEIIIDDWTISLKSVEV